jgi:hypothetical protein
MSNSFASVGNLGGDGDDDDDDVDISLAWDIFRVFIKASDDKSVDYYEPR